MRRLRFYKTANQLWFVDLPEWQGDPDDLQMIQGADEWLDLVSNGKEEIHMQLSPEKFDGAEVLTLIRLGEENLGGGGNYWLENYGIQEIGLKVWFCEVAEFLFKGYPQKIYFTKVKTP